MLKSDMHVRRRWCRDQPEYGQLQLSSVAAVIVAFVNELWGIRASTAPLPPPGLPGGTWFMDRTWRICYELSETDLKPDDISVEVLRALHEGNALLVSPPWDYHRDFHGRWADIYHEINIATRTSL